MLPIEELLAAFPSLRDAPRELPALESWFLGGGITEQARHAAAFILELFDAEDIEFRENEALAAWDDAHRDAYQELRLRLGSGSGVG